MLNVVVSITEIIEYYKNGYMSATVGTRLHLASGSKSTDLIGLQR